ncbi:hypothetical protein PAXINDRAFT_102368 [Paxillus involutus ATCC 200175]|uniref:Uncharacterized protein n=1 Tax=Paxillus involutus ATCC 200175 TaxID=664439 RepID=A0A0C9TDJ1_PAXIN|nr:hypothetical protein PAXINDRAFT_102368 [Paxillus involutus ATCC 200175]
MIQSGWATIQSMIGADSHHGSDTAPDALPSICSTTSQLPRTTNAGDGKSACGTDTANPDVPGPSTCTYEVTRGTGRRSEDDKGVPQGDEGGREGQQGKVNNEVAYPPTGCG